MAQKILPIGIQSFESLRSNHYVYVDKTESIFRLVDNGKIYFLSRPRRFGKSMLISTLDCLFSCKKHLFEGLYVYDKWNWDEPHPVVRIDWTQIEYDTAENLSRNLFLYLQEIAEQNHIEYRSVSTVGLFSELFKKLHEKTGKPVVLLIDEYDKPVTDHLMDGQAEQFRKAIHDFYQVIKGSDDHLRFVLLTGVSKFSGMSVFSALNNLEDITLDKKFSTICGISQQELEENFADYITDTAQELNKTENELMQDIKNWYNGYSWDGKISVYNPFSTLNFFKKQNFQPYWFSTGTPTFLIKILKERGLSNLILEPKQVYASELFCGYSLEKLSEIPLLFQTGYLTISKMEIPYDEPLYTLDVPNWEVNRALMNELINVYYEDNSFDINDMRRQLETRLRSADEEGIKNTLESIVAQVPYYIAKNKEAVFHIALLMWLKSVGFNVLPEVANDRGRCDLIFAERNYTIVAELKYSDTKPLETLLDEAMTQIEERKYYSGYLGRVLKLAIGFTGEKIDCRLEEIAR